VFQAEPNDSLAVALSIFQEWMEGFLPDNILPVIARPFCLPYRNDGVHHFFNRRDTAFRLLLL
jgi:hypothetical protein